MKRLLNEFIAFCDIADVTPAENEIDAFLRKSKEPDKELMRNFLIRFCFYHWEKRKNNIIIDELLLNN